MRPLPDDDELARDLRAVLPGVTDTDALHRMVGFRNLAVRASDKLDLNIVAAVIDHELDALACFAGNMLARYEE